MKIGAKIVHRNRAAVHKPVAVGHCFHSGHFPLQKEPPFPQRGPGSSEWVWQIGSKHRPISSIFEKEWKGSISEGEREGFHGSFPTFFSPRRHILLFPSRPMSMIGRERTGPWQNRWLPWWGFLRIKGRLLGWPNLPHLPRPSVFRTDHQRGQAASASPGSSTLQNRSAASPVPCGPEPQSRSGPAEQTRRYLFCPNSNRSSFIRSRSSFQL